jgi:hypothetical protein
MILKMLSSIILYCPILFILSNLYYLFNYKRLDKPVLEREKNLKIDYLYFLTQLIFYLWLGISLFSELKYYSILILTLIVGRWILNFILPNLSRLIARLTPIIIIICSIFIIVTH